MALTALDDALIARVLSFLCAGEVEAAAVASRVVAREVLPCFPQVWAALFRHRWETLNFPLSDANARLVIDHRLRARFPKSYSDSRVFQLLMHAITPLPAYADLQRTRRASDFDAAKHEIASLHAPETRESHVVNFGFNGAALGDDRCVRANAPFPATSHIGIFKRRLPRSDHGAPLYVVGLVASGYFELTVSARDAPRRPVPADERAEDVAGEAEAPPQEELVSIGLVSDSFPLVGRQPGWNQHSFGYHSDNGHVYRQSTRGQYFGPHFGVNDTVGCGVRRNQRDGRSFIFFTHNGARIARDSGDLECQHESWYPAVGIDSYQQVTMNFGQHEFAHDAIVDEMLAECDAAFELPADDKPEDVLPWFDIADGYSVWRQSKPHSLGKLERFVSKIDDEVEEDEYDEYGEEMKKDDEGECPRQAAVKKWIGFLTQRQQNRLASREEAENVAI